MTSLQQNKTYPEITLPEIEVSNQLDWKDIDFSEIESLSQPSPPTPPVHHPPSQQENSVQQQQPQQQRSDSDSESITTGLTRALSLSRQLNGSTASKNSNEEENMRKEVINISTSNPSHLFWVPASQHPEIAPAEFEKYVDSHGLMIRKKSVRRRQSVLSVYFTASDQQKYLDDLAKMDTDRQAAIDALEGSQQLEEGYINNNRSSDEESKRKLVMRRSVSLHLPSSADYVRNVPDLLVFDRNSSPLDESRALVPKGDRPLLRRGARTNFKRNSSVSASNRPQLKNRKSESDYIDDRKEGDTTNHDSVPIARSSSADGGITLSDENTIKNTMIIEEEPLSPVAEIADDVRDLCIATRKENHIVAEEPPPIVMSRSVSTSTATTSGTNSSRKSSWSWAFWSDEKSSKKNNKIDPVEEQQQQQQEAQDQQQRQIEEQPQASKSLEVTTSHSSPSSGSGKRFTLSSLFSRKSKNQSNNANNINNVDVYNATNQLNAPKDFQLNQMFMTRLPLHVERAVYKLSHIKLANPRRPLHEQVLISNQMFWYLSVIASNPPTQQQQQQQQHVDHYQPQQQKKKPRKLVKKHRPPPPMKQKKTNNVAFMANNNSRESSTGFVVPENYLNPKQQKQPQSQQQKLKKKSSHNGLHSKQQEYEPRHSDSSDDDDDEDILSSDEDDDHTLKSHKEDDNIPLALYKTPSHRVK